MTDEVSSTPVLVVTGPVGVGKSTVAAAISDLLAERGVPHALIDMDWLRWCYPSPQNDPFHMRLGLRNLAAVVANFREAGARWLVLVDIVGTRSELETYRAAIAGANLLVVRLNASLPAIHRRLEGREAGTSLDWHRERAAELLASWEEKPVEDLLVETEGRTVEHIALEVLSRSAWLGAGDP